MKHIKGRAHWGARPATGYTPQEPAHINTLVVHHTAGKNPRTLYGVKRELRNIQRQHMDAQGWSDIGYNLIIDRFGNIWEGRGIRRVGAHTKNCNTGTIGVSFLGNYENERLNAKQIEAFKACRDKLRQHGVHVSRIRGHRDMPGQSTACPGKHIIAQLNL